MLKNENYKLKQIINKRTLVNLYKDIVLVTRVRIFCTKFFLQQQQHKSRDSNACLSVRSLSVYPFSSFIYKPIIGTRLKIP